MGKWACDFNPRSPWGERLLGVRYLQSREVFQSTLPVGGATPVPPLPLALVYISIHAPRGGSDRERWAIPLNVILFQSTLPVGGATPAAQDVLHLFGISIHAPRGGSDLIHVQNLRYATISIHAPRGGSDLHVER